MSSLIYLLPLRFSLFLQVHVLVIIIINVITNAIVQGNDITNLLKSL